VAGFREDDNKLSGFIKDETFLERFSYYELLE
jgi:hypothetical protein